MKLINQVCSLDQAAKLKALGINQVQQTFYWQFGAPHYPVHVNAYQPYFAAFTSAELGEMLPRECYTMLEPGIEMHVWHCGTDNEEVLFQADTEAQAKAELLIWLLEKGKLNPETVNVALAAA